MAEHGPTVLRVCRAHAPAAAAEDAWSETFLSAMRAYPDLDPGANVEAWLVTIARRKCVDQHRGAARRAVPRDVAVSGDRDGTGSVAVAVARDDVPGEPVDEELWSALRALPPKQRDSIVHHHLVGLPYAQVAELLGGSEAAARRAAADGMRRLRETYGRIDRGRDHP